MIKKLFFLEEFGRAFIPEKVRPNLRKHMLKAGINEVPYKLFGALFYISLVITYLLYFYKIYPILQANDTPLLIFLIITFLVWFIIQIFIVVLFMLAIYSYLDLMIYSRTKKIEELLDDFLSFVSENLKGGMSLDRALWTAVKPEFGILSKEIQIASKKVATGEDVEMALFEFTQKYNSPMTRRAFDLIIEGVKGGGEMAPLIDKIVEDLRQTKLMKADIVATNTTYVIFISFIVIVIAPALFSLSHQLLVILQSLSAKVGAGLSTSTVSLPISFEATKITVEEFILFSRIAVSMVAFCSSLIISEITMGNIKGGLKYVPMFILGALASYTFFSYVVGGIFGSSFFNF